MANHWNVVLIRYSESQERTESKAACYAKPGCRFCKVQYDFFAAWPPAGTEYRSDIIILQPWLNYDGSNEKAHTNVWF
jgi:hypothetical protein